MSATGIGASVKRKEDIRFITGKGHYVDDINRPGQAYAYFLRSPHAHATIDKIDASAALKAPGVVAIFTGDDIAADKVGGLICGWMIHSKDGSPMKAGAHPALAQGKVRYVGDHVAVVIADTYAQAKDAAEKIEVHYTELPAVIELAKAASAGQAQIHDAAPNNTIFNWHLGDKAATDAAFASAAHVTKLDLINNRLIPNAMEPRAAVGEYESGTDTLTLYTTSQNPHVARLVLSAFVGLQPEHKFRVIAPDVGGGFGSKIFIYAEETVCAWAAQEDRPAGQMDCRAHRVLPVGRARPRPRHSRRACARRSRQDHGPARAHDRQSSAPICRPSRRSYPLMPMLRCCRASTTSRISMRSRRGLYQHRAGRRLSRRRPAGSDFLDRAHCRGCRSRDRARSGRIPPNELRQVFPASDAGAHELRHGRFSGRARQGARARRLQGSGSAQGGLGRKGQAARRWNFRVYRGLRRCAVASRRRTRRRRGPVGIGGGARQPDRHSRSLDWLPQPRPGQRNDLRAARLLAPRHPDRERLDRPRRH